MISQSLLEMAFSEIEPFVSRNDYRSYICLGLQENLSSHDLSLIVRPLLVRVFDDAASYERERDIIRRFDTPCVKQLFEVNTLEVFNLTTDYEGEQTLRQLLITEGRLPVGKVINFALQLIEFLRDCHREEIIFRSITPDNILVNQVNRLQIMDFQRCFLIGEDIRYEAPAFPREGIEYLSPEYLNRYQLDFRNDIYQLGLLIFELVTGQLPWRYRSIARLLQEKSQPVVHLHKIDSSIPVQFGMLVSRMMEPSPKKRFANIQQVESSIEQLISTNFGAHL